MRYIPLVTLLCIANALFAELWMPAIFTDHMVLQCEQKNPVWGKASPNEEVRLALAGETIKTQADADGKWRAELPAMEPGGPYEFIIRAGAEKRTIKDVMLGEVWVCSGQSNMQWSIRRSDEARLEQLTANYPEIRLLTIPRNGTQELQDDFDAQWEVCTPETVEEFSAVGYSFGRRLHHATGRAIGLIDNAWGGSSAEAWVPRDVLESYPEQYGDYIQDYIKKTTGFTDEVLAQKLAEWEAAPKDERGRKPRDPRNNQHRPANIYNGMVHPIQTYGIRGMIWYQGESNASRAENYKHLFPLMITQMRDKWSQGDFPFYWVQLADFKEESDTPQDTDWALLREAQTETLKLPNTGQAVIIDIGEGRDIHPRNKQRVADRLARHALSKTYDFEIHAESPRYGSMQKQADTIKITFDHVTDQGLRAFDTEEVHGFAIAGEDKVFHWANAEIEGKDSVVVRSDAVPNPVAVRYAWGDNPVCNLYDRDGLPVTPFRTDDW